MRFEGEQLRDILMRQSAPVQVLDRFGRVEIEYRRACAAVGLLPLARPSQFEGLTGAKPFRISEGYPRVFTTEKGGGDLFWRDLGGLDPGRRLRGECDPSLVQ